MLAIPTGDDIGEEGVREMCKALKENTSLTSLKMMGNKHQFEEKNHRVSSS